MSVSQKSRNGRLLKTDPEQFLNSVLTSISDSKAEVVAPTVKAQSNAAQANRTEANTVAFRQNAQPPIKNIASVPNKRKAESELLRSNEKIQRAERADRFDGKPSSRGTVPDKSLVNGKPTLKISAASPVVYKGTGRPSPIALVSNEAKPTAKKGSFAEIMARGKSNVAPVGVIIHKPKERTSSKKEMEELQKREKASKGRPGGSLQKGALDSNGNSPGPSKPKSGVSLNGKHAKPPGYQGTAKAKPQTTYKGTIKPLPSVPASVRKKDHDGGTLRGSKSASQARRKETYSDEESDQDEEGSYVSEEDYSDMEAGFEDVEEEDEKASKLAKKEDDYEKMMLDELKRQKEAKKQRLTALAEKARRRQ
ncbi:hypothetical protein MMC13_002966 [Lambiella insularis]|nr:hypothetical protein [Lambiella insularis]